MIAITTLMIVLAAPPEPAQVEVADAPLPQAAPSRPFRPLDVSADTLAPGKTEVGVFFGRVTRGLFPRLHVSAHLAAYLVSLVNLSARVLLVDEPSLRVSLEAGVWWLAAGPFLKSSAMAVPGEVRASVPMPLGFETSFAVRAQWLQVELLGTRLGSTSLTGEVTVARYDSSGTGAWFIQGRVPFVGAAGLGADVFGVHLEGTAVFGNMPAWSVLVARDQPLGESLHLRLGIGYRNHFGLVGLESIGPVAYNLDLYWRF